MPVSLSRRLIPFASILAAASVAVVATTAGLAVRAVLDREYLRDVGRGANTLAMTIAGSGDGSFDDLSMLPIPEGYRVLIFDPGLELLGSTDGSRNVSPVLSSAISARFLSGTENTFILRVGRTRTAVGVALLRSGTGAREDRSDVLAVLRAVDSSGAIGPTVIAVSLAALSTVAIGFSLVVGRVFGDLRAPLETIHQSVQQWILGDLGAPLLPAGPTETRELVAHLTELSRVLGVQVRLARERQELVDGVLAGMSEGVVVTDLKRRIIATNDSFVNLFQGAVDRPAGRTIVEYTRNVDLDELVASSVDAGDVRERVITRYQDPVSHLQAHAAPLRSHDGDIVGSILVVNDVSRLKRLEQIRTEFVANVSHELRTPITSIAGFVETLLESPPESESERRRFLEIVANHANRLNLIIEDLLSLSRLEQEDATVELDHFDVRELASEVVDACAVSAESRRITIGVDTGSVQDATGNRSLLRQALVNLVDNAIKFSDSGSEVFLTFGRSGDDFVVKVRDEGVGIPEADLPRVFERFYRTDKARSRELGGTGLGLAIVKHIARVHQGDVEVDSRLGEGTTFALRIPQAPGSQRDLELRSSSE